jgi:hypothetical protein
MRAPRWTGDSAIVFATVSSRPPPKRVPHQRRQLVERAGRSEGGALLAPEEPETAPRTHGELPAAVGLRQRVLPVAEEDERPVDEPADEVGDRSRVAGGALPTSASLELGRDRACAGDHRGEIVGDQADVLQPRAYLLRQPIARRRVADRLERDVGERLARPAVLDRPDELDASRRIAARGDDGMEKRPHRRSRRPQTLADGIDDERAVGHDGLENRERRVPALVRVRRREDAHAEVGPRSGVEAERRRDQGRRLLVGEPLDPPAAPLDEEPRERPEPLPVGAARAPREESPEPLCRHPSPLSAARLDAHQPRAPRSVTSTSPAR